MSTRGRRREGEGTAAGPVSSPPAARGEEWLLGRGLGLGTACSLVWGCSGGKSATSYRLMGGEEGGIVSGPVQTIDFSLPLFRTISAAGGGFCVGLRASKGLNSLISEGANL